MLAVVGAGSWGTTIASLLAPRAATLLWARSPELARSLEDRRENEQYLPGVRVPDTLEVTADLKRAVSDAEFVFMAVPAQGFRDVLVALAPHAGADSAVVILTKGIEAGSNLRMSEIVAEVLPGIPAGVLTGPNLAQEIAAGQPAASVVAFASTELAQRVQAYLHTGTLRVYTATDVTGCEVAGATKNVMAIAAGICDGLGFGGNTRAALITRGLAELARLGTALGGHPLTFGGLAGVGDLMATCTSARSRNWSVGFSLAGGRPLADVVASTSMVAEGVNAAAPLALLARQHGVEMPIVEQIAAIVQGRVSPRDALASLLLRPARDELDEIFQSGLPAD
jgi:glycerol-3-phosphate dehydrogenase (NAD(P)+)